MDGLFRRRNLPHFDITGGTYFVTFCLAGSLPASGALAVAERWRRRAAHPPAGTNPRRWRAACLAAAFAAADRRLDRCATVRWLADFRLARVVDDAIRYRHGTSYALLAYVVMPSHCHVVFTPLVDAVGERPAREAILHSLKRHTASRCNRLLGRRGALWQPESFDRLLRGPAGVAQVVEYVERNPVAAGLCNAPEEWEFSSARRRPPALHPM